MSIINVYPVYELHLHSLAARRSGFPSVSTRLRMFDLTSAAGAVYCLRNNMFGRMSPDSFRLDMVRLKTEDGKSFVSSSDESGFSHLALYVRGESGSFAPSLFEGWSMNKPFSYREHRALNVLFAHRLGGFRLSAAPFLAMLFGVDVDTRELHHAVN